MARALTGAMFVSMFLLVSSLNGEVLAYLDPGTGSMVLQALLAGVVGALAVGRLYWQRLKGLITRRSPRNSAEDE